MVRHRNLGAIFTTELASVKRTIGKNIVLLSLLKLEHWLKCGRSNQWVGSLGNASHKLVQ